MKAITKSSQHRYQSRLQALGLLAILAISPAPLCAQDSLRAPDSLSLTLSELLARIQDEHPANQQGVSQTTAAVARAAGLTRLSNPQFDFQRVIAEYQWTVTQALRWPWEQGARRRLGAAEVEVTRAEVRVAQQALIFVVAGRFADALRDREALVLAVEAESLATLGVNRAVAARDMGQGGDLTVLQARVTLDAARRERVAVEEEGRAAIAGMHVILGLAPETRLVLRGDLASLAPMPADTILDPTAITTDPEAGRLTALASRADREWRLARSRIVPELQTGPNYGYTSILHRGRWGWNISATLPLFLNQGDAIRAARADQAAMVAARSARERELSLQLREASMAHARAAQQLASLRGGDLLRAAQAESLAVRALQQGGPFMTTWLATHEAHLSARKAELALEWEAAQARLLLKHLSGTLIQVARGGS